MDELVGVTSSPTIVDDVAYFGDWAGDVHAVDAGHRRRGLDRSTLGGSVIGSLPVEGDALYASSGTTVYRLDRATGEVIWEASADDHPFAMASASPVVAGGVVLQGLASGEVTFPQDDYTFTGSISGFDAETGDRLWRVDTTPGDRTAGAGVGIWSTPAVDLERGLAFVGHGQHLRGALRAPGRQPAGPRPRDRRDRVVPGLHVARRLQRREPGRARRGHRRRADALDDRGPRPGRRRRQGAACSTRWTGRRARWSGRPRLTPGSAFGGVNGSSAFVDGTIVASSNVGDPATNAPLNTASVFGLDAGSGEVLWQYDLDGMVFAPVSTAPGLAFVASTLGRLVVLDAATGDELWTRELGRPVGAGPVVVDGTVLWGYGYTLFGDPGDGGVVAFAPRGR